MAVEPTGDKVFDPFLGGERDPFPGEVVPPEQETDFDRQKRLAAQPYLDLYDLAARRGGLSQAELIGVLKAAQLAAEAKGAELEKAFTTNPATIIQRVLIDESQGALILDRAIGTFNAKIRSIQERVNNQITSDRVAGTAPETTSEYVSRFIPPPEPYFVSPERPQVLTTIPLASNSSEQASAQVFKILQLLGGIPDPSITSFAELSRALPTNIPEDPPLSSAFIEERGGLDRPRFARLPSNLPGLDGVYFQLLLEAPGLGAQSFSRATSFGILATPEAFTKIVDKAAGFTPITPKPTQ